MDIEKDDKYWQEQYRKSAEERKRKNEQLLALPKGLSLEEERHIKKLFL